MIPHAAWPVDPSALGPFLIAVALVELTPGPNMAWLAAIAMAQGRRAGLLAVAGVTAGLAVYLLAVVVGIGQAIASAPSLLGALHLAGALYLLWLAVDAWRGVTEPTPKLGAAPFWRGFAANILNAKAAVFYITLLPGFIAPDHGHFSQHAMILGALHIAVSIAVHCSIVFAAARTAHYLQTGQAAMLRRSLALGLMLVAAWLLWEGLR